MCEGMIPTESRMREIRTSGSTSGGWNRGYGRRSKHRRESVRRTPRTLRAPRQPSTLPSRIGFAFGIQRDISAPDVNTTAQIMAWIMDQYGSRYGHTPGIVTGKPLALGGSPGREAAREFGIDIKGARVVIQGFGNVGSFAARFLHEQGARVIAVGDASGGLLAEDGLDISDLIDYSVARRSIEGFGSGDKISNEELLKLDCDILIPAALGCVITKDNANDITTRMIVEAANSPVTTMADAILNDRNIPIVPDILANAGGVTVSYFEWVQNIQALICDETEVNEKVERIMSKAYGEVVALMRQKSVSMRTGAFMIGIERVAEAERLRGGT